jgi:hypothetical protein
MSDLGTVRITQLLARGTAGSPQRIDPFGLCGALSPRCGWPADLQPRWRVDGLSGRGCRAEPGESDLRRRENASEVQHLDGVQRETLQFTLDSRSLVYLTRADGFSQVWQRPVEKGTPRKLIRVDVGNINSMRLAPDGHRMLLTTWDESPELLLFENFR